jgi:tRNA nucleotidyltransferase (CCA-adding enzyme)
MTPSHAEIDPARLPERLAALPGIDRVREAAGGIQCYLVGGAVRDLLLGRKRTDIDVVVEGEVEELASRLGGELRVHERFATASVRVDGLEVDLARTRSETYARPGALPDVRPAPLEDDLARRDFTINAMAVRLTGDADLIDPHRGLEDLREGLLRVLHPRSLADDPTRALRAARYAARYGFGLEPGTEELVRGADLTTVSQDRIDAELRKLAGEPEAPRGFALLTEWGLVTPASGIDLIQGVAELVSREPWFGAVDRADVVLGAALGRGLEAARELARAAPRRPSEAVELARGRSVEELAIARAMGAEWLDRYLSEWRAVRLEIDGHDLLTAGVPEGPAVGRGLDAALCAKLDGETRGRDDELRTALSAARENSPRR